MPEQITGIFPIAILLVSIPVCWLTSSFVMVCGLGTYVAASTLKFIHFLHWDSICKLKNIFNDDASIYLTMMSQNYFTIVIVK